MAIVAADWTLTRSTKVIDYVGNDHGGGSPSYATVLEFHRWLGSLADDASSVGDDQLDRTDVLPSFKQFDTIITLLNGYTLTAAGAEHLYDGSIIQGGGTDIWDGIVNYGNASVQIQIIQAGAVLTDDWWNFAGGGLNADAAQGISHRFIIKVRTAGTDIDGRRLVGTSRSFGNTFSEFSINGSARGNNTLALGDVADVFNQTASGTVATWSAIDNSTEGYVLLDVDNNATPEAYAAEWNRDTFTINQFYERMKYLTRDGSAETLYGLNGELFRGITHQITIGSGSGTWAGAEPLSWSGGTGQLIAVDDTDGTTASALWMQLLTGVAPTDSETITGGTSSADAVASGAATSRAIATPFIGASTGSALLGAYGWGIETSDLSASDRLRDLTNTQITPPNNVTFTVAGVVSGEDSILVAPWDGSTTDSEGNPAVEKDQLTLSTPLSGGAETSVVVTAAIPADTPATGTIRVVTDAGFNKRETYTSWTGSTFTINSSDYSSDNATSGNDVYITYLDLVASATSHAFTGVYGGDRDLVVSVRDGGGTPIKEYITSAVFGSAATTITAIRNSDA